MLDIPKPYLPISWVHSLLSIFILQARQCATCQTLNGNQTLKKCADGCSPSCMTLVVWCLDCKIHVPWNYNIRLMILFFTLFLYNPPYCYFPQAMSVDSKYFKIKLCFLLHSHTNIFITVGVFDICTRHQWGIGIKLNQWYGFKERVLKIFKLISDIKILKMFSSDEMLKENWARQENKLVQVKYFQGNLKQRSHFSSKE